MKKSSPAPVRWLAPVDHLAYEEIMAEIDRRLEKNLLPINVYINSEGGFVSVAISFCAEVKERRIPLNTFVLGRCNSSAIPIMMMGRRRGMDADAHIFFHPLEFRKGEEREKIKNMTNWYKEMISKRSRLTPKDVNQLMNDKALLSAAEAKKMGLIHYISDEPKEGRKKNER